MTEVSTTEIWCHIHNEPEPNLPGDFKACGECCHVWRTEIEFRGDLTKWHGLSAWFMPLDQVWACPLCTHDF